jgi:hypothetical protein
LEPICCERNWWQEAGMAKRYRVTLTREERDELDRMISRGKADARKLTHARVFVASECV